jgi:hypothetical protein
MIFLPPQIAIRMPVAEYTAAELNARPGTPAFQALAGDMDKCETWEMWNTLRGLCSYNPRLTLSACSPPSPVPSKADSASLAALDLTNPLPPSRSLDRWMAEPVKHIFLPCTSFIPNAKGYPVLSKSMQAFLKTVFKVRILSFFSFFQTANPSFSYSSVLPSSSPVLIATFTRTAVLTPTLNTSATFTESRMSLRLSRSTLKATWTTFSSRYSR